MEVGFGLGVHGESPSNSRQLSFGHHYIPLRNAIEDFG